MRTFASFLIKYLAHKLLAIITRFVVIFNKIHFFFKIAVLENHISSCSFGLKLKWIVEFPLKRKLLSQE